MIQPIVLPRPSIFHFAEAQPGTESYESVRCSPPRVQSWASASASLSTHTAGRSTTTPCCHPLLVGPINCPYLAQVVRPRGDATTARRPPRRPNPATGINHPSCISSENGSLPQSPSVLLGQSQHELAPDIDRSSADRIGDAILGVQTIPETMVDLV